MIQFLDVEGHFGCLFETVGFFVELNEIDVFAEGGVVVFDFLVRLRDVYVSIKVNFNIIPLSK